MSTLSLSFDMMLVLGILGLTFILFAFEIVRVDVAGITILVILGLTGLVSGEQLFTGFASNAVISIIAVMILGAGLDRTGVMNQVAAFILRIGGSTENRIMPLVSGSVGVISGFMQNVGAAALFLPVVSRIASRSGLMLSRLLMPMGFCAILGGTLTMVGSSPLILLNDLIQTSNRSLPQGVATMGEFGLFSVMPVGLALIASGVIYFLVLGKYLLPARRRVSATPARTESYFAEQYGLRGDFYELEVSMDSPLVGQQVGEAETIPNTPLLLGIKGHGSARLAPPSDEMIFTNTILGVMGQRDQVEAFAADQQLTMRPRLAEFGRLFNPARAGIAEAVIPPGSRFIGRTVATERMRQRYGISVLAINRGGEVHRDEVRDIVLQSGDSLVIHAAWRDLGSVSDSRDMVVVTDIPKTEERPNKVGWAVTFFAIALGMVIFTDFRLSVSLLTGAIGMILTGVIGIDEAYQAVSWKTVFLLASLIPLGLAMESTGTAAWIAQQVIDLVGTIPVWGYQLVLAVLATFFTLVMSNVGATVLLVPLGINIALSVGGDPAMFALIVALATSNAFILPTHQVNALIMGPGGYGVADFMKVGGAMTVIFLGVMLPVVNLVF